MSVDEALTESTPESLELPAYIRYGFKAMLGTLEKSLFSDTPLLLKGSPLSFMEPV